MVTRGNRDAQETEKSRESQRRRVNGRVGVKTKKCTTQKKAKITLRRP